MQVIMAATGVVKQVPDGYARNYLFPKQLAKPATADGVKAAQAQQAQQAADQAARQAEYGALAARVADTTVEYSAKASEAGRLFSAVHADAIIAQLAQQGVVVPALSVTLPAIKQVGSYEGSLRLPGQPMVHFMINITAQ